MNVAIASFVTGMRRRAGNWFAAADRLLLPPRCAFCHADFLPAHDDALLCADCERDLVPLLGPTCRQCGATVPLPQPPGSTACPVCAEHHWYFDTVIPLGRYRESLRAAVLRTKLAAEEPLARALGRLLFMKQK